MDIHKLLIDIVKQEKTLETVYDYDVDSSKQTIYFHDDVDEESASNLIKMLRYVDANLCLEDSDVITLHICSYGGSVDHMFAIYDAIQSTKHQVNTVGTGAICSAAFLILAAGTKSMATQNAHAMIHKISGGAFGSEEEIEAQSFLVKKYQQLYYDILAQHTKLTAAQWRDLVKDRGEGWLDVNEMLETGLIDEIVEAKTKPPRKRKTTKKISTKK